MQNKAVGSPDGRRTETKVWCTLPEVADLDDEGVERWFPNNDGKWSSLTKHLVARFGAKGLDLNENWHGTPMSWTCGCCGRGKHEIVRMTRGGVLLAHLHYHHDHIKDHLLDALNAKFGVPWTKGVPVEWRPGEGKVRDMVIRFRDTLVCDGCNTAEGEAKRALGLPRHFSFSPREIARFVRATPNAMAGIDVDEARAAWLSAKEGFENRCAFAVALVERLSSGLLAVERNENTKPEYLHTGADELLRLAMGANRGPGTLHDWACRQSGELRLRSTSRDGFGNSAREAKPTPVKVSAKTRSPTDAELAAFGLKASLSWGRTPEDWSCPCCGRGKRGILRVAEKGWFAQIRVHPMVELEGEPASLAMRRALYPGHLVSPVVREVVPRYICSDCDDLRIVLRQKKPGFDPLLTLEDIQACTVEVRDNGKHRFDLDRAVDKAEGNRDLSVALAQFREHERAVASLWELYETYPTADRESAAPSLIGACMKLGVQVGGVRGALGWMLRQAKRLVVQAGRKAF